MGNSDVIVNGVALPPGVAEELQRLGIALSWRPQWELEAAVRACKVTPRLVEDPDGLTLEDQMVLTPEEEEEHRARAEEAEEAYIHGMHTFGVVATSHVERLHLERLARLGALHTGPPPIPATAA